MSLEADPQQVLISVPAHQGKDENQRFTPPDALAWLYRIAGIDGFDLDVAACQESHHAPHWYGLDHPEPARRDGLVGSWGAFDHSGPRVINAANPWSILIQPPWDDLYPWLRRAWGFWSVLPYPTVMVALLPGNRTHRPWWQEFVERQRRERNDFRDYCPPKRFAYGGPGNPRGVGVTEPNFTSVGLVWRRPQT